MNFSPHSWLLLSGIAGEPDQKRAAPAPPRTALSTANHTRSLSERLGRTVWGELPGWTNGVSVGGLPEWDVVDAFEGNELGARDLRCDVLACRYRHDQVSDPVKHQGRYLNRRKH